MTRVAVNGDPFVLALEQCAAEPIHTPGAVQSFGVLLVLDESLLVRQCSTNSGDFFGSPPEELLGRNVDDLFDDESLAHLRTAVDQLAPAVVEDLGEIRPRRRFDRPPATGQIHFYNGSLLLELIPAGRESNLGGYEGQSKLFTRVFHNAASQLTQAKPVDEYCQQLTKKIQFRTGYDRVVVYRFDADWNGEVIAEARRPDLEPFIGFHFPASDIPAQARRLYLLNRVRTIADVEATPALLTPPTDPTTGRHTDLSHALLRAVSPVHLQYLRNMGVRATLVASIVREDRLWGLVACHHLQPFLPSASIRSMVGALAEMAGAEVELFESRERARGARFGQQMLRHLPPVLAAYGDWAQALASEEAGLLELLDADGLATVSGGLIHCRGATPPPDDIRRLIVWLDRKQLPFLATDRLGSEEPSLAGLASTASGVLAIRASDNAGCWAIWFRREWSHTICWGGEPKKDLVEVDGVTRLSPRQSFLAWTEEVRGRARPWSEVEIALANEGVRPNLQEVLASFFRRQSEELRSHYGNLFEQVNDAVVVTSLAGVVTFWNEGAARLFGLRADQMLGRRLGERYPVWARLELEKLLYRVSQGEEFLGELKDQDASGSPLCVNLRMQPVRGPDGAPCGIMSIFRDVTKEKKAEAELNLMQAVVTNTRDAILITEAEPFESPGPRILYANPAFLRDTGYSLEEVVGRTPRILQGPNTDRAALEKIKAALRRWQPVRVEVLNYRKDGSEFWADLDITPVADANGWYTHWISVQRDVTERKAVFEELLRSKASAEAASRAKSEFLANMSHEVRTPMNGILGMTDLVLGTSLDADQRNCLETVKSSADSLLSIINDILDFSKIEAGKLDLDPVDFELDAVLADALRPLTLRAHEKGLELILDVDPRTPNWIKADPVRLRQIVLNFVSNAVKFTQVGEVLVAVDAVRDSAPGGGWLLHVAVRDTGVGIPAEKQKVIFEPFTQADGSTTRTFGGTGLGLTICGRLVGLMGGRISLESEPERGSTFHFTVPVEDAASPRPTNPSALLRDLRGISILIVDDNPTNRRILLQATTSWGMDAEAVGSALDAIAALKRRAGKPAAFEVVLLDALMPEVDGFTLAEQIIADPQLKGVVIMMLSSAGQTASAARCRELGLAGYLVKPVHRPELFSAISRTMGVGRRPRSRPSEHGVPPADDVAFDAAGLRVLVAEDNVVNQKLAVRLLEKRGCHVALAADGDEALARIAAEPFDLVLMDVQMPVRDGLSATTELRNREMQTGVRLPVIALTANAMSGDRERCLAAGCDEYVSKPILPKELFTAVARVIGPRGQNGCG